jgi:gliding motility-associated-like protein
MLQFSVAFSQKEANWWHFGRNVAMDFSSGSPVYSFTSAIGSPQESCASVSDSLGKLLFYTNGDTVWDRNNNVMPNGTNLEVGFYSASQGAHIIRNVSSNLYYLFSLGNSYVSHSDRSFLHYAIVDLTQNLGNGAIVKKNVALTTPDSLFRKMTSAQHCNRKDVWLIVAGVSNNELTLYSYLITKDGVNNSPVKTTIRDINKRSWISQMKYNVRGDVLAWADNNGLNIFKFDKETGKFIVDNFIPLTLTNGYGLEFSPDGNNIYINEKQYNLQTNSLTQLLNYDCPSQLQMANDGKIYKMHFPKAEILDILPENNWLTRGSINNAFRITQIKNPNIAGLGCGFDTTFVYDFTANYPNYTIGLPNFPSYYFHHPKGEFSYSGNCVGNQFQFYLKNNPVVSDSIKWIFYDTNQSAFGQTATYTFANSGSQQVSCLVFNNGKADTTTQCVTVCGAGYSALPDTITSCIGTTVNINGASPCGSRYKWNTGDTLSGINVTQSGNYILETKSECGIFYETVYVNFIACDPEYLIPNVFTPNGDGMNDLYSIQIKNVKEVEYYIYDRWGGLVKQHQEAVNVYNALTKYDVWDGMENNVSHSDGTYFLILNLKTFDEKNVVVKQFISLFGN